MIRLSMNYCRRMTVDKMTVFNITVDKMTVFNITVDKMTVDEMTVDKNVEGITLYEVRVIL